MHVKKVSKYLHSLHRFLCSFFFAFYWDFSAWQMKSFRVSMTWASQRKKVLLKKGSAVKVNAKQNTLSYECEVSALQLWNEMCWQTERDDFYCQHSSDGFYFFSHSQSGEWRVKFNADQEIASIFISQQSVQSPPNSWFFRFFFFCFHSVSFAQQTALMHAFQFHLKSVRN